MCGSEVFATLELLDYQQQASLCLRGIHWEAAENPQNGGQAREPGPASGPGKGGFEPLSSPATCQLSQ